MVSLMWFRFSCFARHASFRENTHPKRLLGKNLCIMMIPVILYFFLITFLANFVRSKQAVYVSRFSGSDNKTCGKQYSPCRTISYGIHQASEGSYIFLDGKATSKDPYTCQPFDSHDTRMYITKSLSFVCIKQRAHISCPHRSHWFVDGRERKNGLRVSFYGLSFQNTSFRFFDVSLNVRDSFFMNSVDVLTMNFTLFNLHRYHLLLDQVVFQQNAACLSIKNFNDRIKTSVRITNSVFMKNGYGNASVLPSVLWLNSSEGNISIVARNCSFKRNSFNKKGIIVFVENRKGQITFDMNRFQLEENGFDSFAHDPPESSIFMLLSAAHVHVSLRFGSVYNTIGIFVAVSSWQFAKVNLSNTDVDKFYTSISKGGGLIYMNAPNGFLSLKHSNFRNGRNIWNGGVVSIIVPILSATIQNSTFYNISSPGCGGAVYVFSNHFSTSQNGSKDFFVKLNIYNSSFLNCSSYEGGAVCMDVEMLVATIVDAEFQGNRAESIGGALELVIFDAASIYLQNVSFIENSASRSGIVVASARPTDSPFNFTCNNVRFVGNKLHALRQQNDILAVLLLLFKRNKGNVVLKNTLFTENTGKRTSSILLRFLKSRLPSSPSIIIDSCVFRESFLHLGALLVSGQALLVCKHSTFDSVGRSPQVPCNFPPFAAEMNNSEITVINSTFVSNFCGAIRARLSKNSCLKVKDSRFLRNRVKGGEGGAMFIFFVPPNKNKVHQNQMHPAYNNVLIERVFFQENVASRGSVLTIINGRIKILNCLFENNLARTNGGQVTSFGSTDMELVSSVFKQTVQRILICNKTEFVTSSFLRIHGTGELFFYNTTVDLETMTNEPLILVSKATQLLFDNSSVVSCPIGSDIKKSIYNYKDSEDRNVTVLELSCQQCGYNFYSLQRGYVKGLNIDDSFKCTPCPRGADCLPAIKSKPNFWGFKDSSNPPTLAFTLCPFGYCKSASHANSHEYNQCQGKRTGVMCGECSDGYTEALWSSQCTAIIGCNDYWFWIGFLALITVMAVLLVFKPPVFSYLLRHVLWIKTCTRVTNQPQYDVIRSLSSLEEATLSSSQRSKHDKRQFSRFLEIIFYFYQISRMLLSSHSLSEFFGTTFIPIIIGFFNFEPSFNKTGFLCPFPGLTPKTKLVFKILPVLGTVIAIFIIFIFNCLICRLRKTLRPSVTPYLLASIKTVLLGYVTLATVSFSLIRCVFVAGEDRWFYNGNITCYQWWQYVALIFNGTFVIPFIFVLAWTSFKLHYDTITVRQFLLATIFPLPLLLFWLFRLVCPSVEADGNGSQTLNALKEMFLGPYRKPGNGSKYGALYWKSIFIARRFVLVLIYCTVTEPSIKFFLMTLTCVLVLSYHLKIKPFCNSLANNCETLSLLFLVILGLINLLKSVFIGSEGNIKGSLVTVFQIFKWIEIVILGLFPALLSILICLAIISLVVRILYICCRLLFRCLFRRPLQGLVGSHSQARMVTIAEEIN